ncbi:hypothetical protein [Bartonella bovis]|uniref:hypothetical protein n=1 Tax=Bartonella bovis TaxID=155194 RepID=UPI00178C37BC|nr:hypothetical protein [Bartonella bovis]
MTKVTITGEGVERDGVIMGGTKMMTMTNVDISKVEKGWMCRREVGDDGGR